MSFRNLVNTLNNNVNRSIGEVVTFDNNHQVRGVFDLVTELIDPETNTIVNAENPTLNVKISDVPNISLKNFVNIRNVTYRVEDIRTIDDETYRLLLQEIV
jgi:hypothetical protein